MSPKSVILQSSIIVSVYDDDNALSLILDSLCRQTVNTFEIIISEDGQSTAIKDVLAALSPGRIAINHLTQEDRGFRKTRALNRAIRAARTDHLVFIDGDCLIHPCFVAAHQAVAGPGVAGAGRRMELGEKISGRLRAGELDLAFLSNRLSFFRHAPALLRDRVKNIESGLYSPLLQRLTTNRQLRLVGCNFSCHRDDLLRINGFNEDYQAPGIGEDSDLDWRLERAGVRFKNIKFSAIQYHLHHPKAPRHFPANKEIFKQTRRADQYICTHGLQDMSATEQQTGQERAERS